MKITINLEDVWSGDEFGTTVAQIIHDEIVGAIRGEIKRVVNEEKKKILTQIETIVKDSFGKLGKNQITEISKKLLVLHS